MEKRIKDAPAKKDAKKARRLRADKLMNKD